MEDGNGDGGSALDAGLNILGILFGGSPEKRAPARQAHPASGKRTGAGCNCTGKRVPALWPSPKR